MTILLIHGDRNQHENFREMVRRINPVHQCLKSFSTESALELLLSTDCELPDMIFLDLKFRAKSGMQMLTALKGSKELREIPVCIYTDSTSQSDRDETHNLGAIGYVVHEDNFYSLSELIRAVIEPHGESK